MSAAQRGGDVKATRLLVDQTWDGEPVGDDERASLELRLGEAELSVETEAPFHADPAPPGPPGSCDGLWEFEAVELFLLGDGQRYLEIELGPLGHYLVLQLRRARCVEAHGLPLEYASERVGGRWRGRARVPLGYLPPGLRACNAYAIHGLGPRRRYLAAHPVPGREPDFHRLDCFRALGW